MKSGDLHDLDEKTLREHVSTARRDLFGLRMQHATGELENTAGLKTAKRDLARALTVARQRGIDPTSAKRGDDARSAGGRKLSNDG